MTQLWQAFGEAPGRSCNIKLKLIAAASADTPCVVIDTRRLNLKPCHLPGYPPDGQSAVAQALNERRCLVSDS
jgi:hypothetical protein